MAVARASSSSSTSSVWLVGMVTLLGYSGVMRVSGGRMFDACAMCECTDRYRVVNCTGLNMHEGVSVHYPSKMQVLILNSNNYTYLGEAAFANAPDLVTLKLQSNYIRVVHRNAFQGLSNLRQLYLCSNLIETLSEGVFSPSGNLTYLSLQYNSVTIPSLGTAIRSAPNLQTLDITGLPMGSTAEYRLPTGFASLGKLQVLYLEESLTHLPADMFGALQNSSLFYLSLARSRLENISIDAFMPIDKLQSLELSRTLLPVPTAERIFEAISRANISLKHLNIRHNFIMDADDNILDPETFQYLQNSSVHVLHLEKSWSGFQGHISKHFFRYMPELHELYLDNCRLTNIHGQAFKDLKELSTLSLPTNYLSCYTGCSFLVTQHFHHLQHLDLSDNVIGDQAQVFKFKKENFPQLQTLNLARNKIASIPSSTFGDLKHLRRLDLSFNPLSSLDSGVFVSLHHLQYLRVSECPLLEHVPAGAFRGLRSLHTLTLSNNNIMTMHNNAFEGLNNLESLSLRNNKLSSTSLNRTSLHSTTLAFLDVGENELLDIPYNLLSKQPQLTTVYLDHNRISEIQLEMLSVLGSVSLLDLSYNDIIYLDSRLFSRGELLNLRTFSVAGNPLMCDCSMEAFLEWYEDARKHDALNIISEEKHVCHGPPEEKGRALFLYQPTHWTCHVKVYAVPVLCVLVTVCVTWALVCTCKRRPNDDQIHAEYRENELDNAEESGSLTHINGHAPSSTSALTAAHHNGEAQTSSSVDSSQSSITGLCLPLHSFRRSKKRDPEHEANGHVLLESDDSEPEDTIVEDAVV